MTEQSKIEPGMAVGGEKPAGTGKSLFERIDELGEGHPFAAPPVPRDLAAPVNRRPVPRMPSRPASVAATPAAGKQMPASEQPRMVERRATPDPVPTLAPAQVQVPEREVEQVHFREDKVHQIDRRTLARNGLIQPEAQVSALLEEFRIVKRRVLASVRKAREAGSGAMAQRVLVCSPLPGEGKSFTAANLALAMAAEKDGEVLLVDADFAKPSVLSLLGLPRGPGFMDVLANPSIKLEDCIMATDIAGFHVLPAGNHTNSDSEYLASTRTAEVLEMLTHGSPNRIVIFDSSPALAASPAAELAHHVGQAIVVARADRTGQGALEDALTLLSACPDLKLLLNAAHFSPSGRRFGAYYGQEA